MRLLLAFLGVVVMSMAAEITPAGDGFTVSTPVYTAAVNGNMALTSLRVGEQEFLCPATIAGTDGGALWCTPFGQWPRPQPMPGAPTQDGDTLRAEGHGWQLAYTFHEDAVDITFFGTPEGQRPFTEGYPPSQMWVNLRPDLHRCANPALEGDLGWPVTRQQEPGDYGIMAANGAGLVFENTFRLQHVKAPGQVTGPADGQLNAVWICTYEQSKTPVTRRIRVFGKAPLPFSLSMEIESPTPGHMFPGKTPVEFPVTVTAHYGQTLDGALRFTGEGYVWKDNKIVAEVPLRLTAEQPTQTVVLPLKPPVPGHYTGLVSVVRGDEALYSRRLGLVYQPERIPAAVQPPDFAEFWRDTLAKLDEIPLDLTLEEQKEHETAAGRAYKAKFRAWDGRWAWAWLYVPKKEGKVAATVRCPPVSNYQPGLCGNANGQLEIAVAIHGGDISERPAKSDFDYMNTGIESRETYMLRYGYTCLARCYDIIKARPECNGQIYVAGGSQGAGLSLVLGALRPDATEVRGVAIALCRIDWTILGLAKWGPRCPAGADPQQIAEVVRYYDPACFTPWIKAPVVLGFGLFDFCAPAEGIFSAVNALPKTTPHKVYVDPYGGHFTYNHELLKDAAQGVTVPHWEGSAEDNKLND